MTLTAEITLRSLPKRSITLSFKLANKNTIDYYFNMQHLASEYGGRMFINNTQATRHYHLEWETCPAFTCPPRPVESDFDKIPAQGVSTYEVSVSHRCGFLYVEPLGYKHWMRLSQGPIPLYDGPMGNRMEDSIYIDLPDMIELPFMLIDEGEDPEEDLLQVVSDDELVLAGSAATIAGGSAGGGSL